MYKRSELRTLIQEYYPQADDVQNFQNSIILNVQQNYRNALYENTLVQYQR